MTASVILILSLEVEIIITRVCGGSLHVPWNCNSMDCISYQARKLSVVGACVLEVHQY